MGSLFFWNSLSAPYDYCVAAQARQDNWLVREIDAGHFQMLVDPLSVTEMLLTVIEERLVRGTPYRSQFGREGQEG